MSQSLVHRKIRKDFVLYRYNSKEGYLWKGEKGIMEDEKEDARS